MTGPVRCRFTSGMTLGTRLAQLAACVAAVAALVTLAVTPDAAAGPSKPLKGFVVVIDPGHQLGNRNFTKKINAKVANGVGGKKACNTTGTATNKGDTYGKAIPEATVNWKVAAQVKKQLTSLGATVMMTRTSNSNKLWGPCIDKRGKLGNGKAHLLVSIHADGAKSSAHGFHLLVTAKGHKNHAASLKAATAMRTELGKAGLKRATYVKNALRPSRDYATLNHSSKPAVIVEMGNMRNRADARRLTSAKGQKQYATAIVAGIKRYLVSTK